MTRCPFISSKGSAGTLKRSTCFSSPAPTPTPPVCELARRRDLRQGPRAKWAYLYRAVDKFGNMIPRRVRPHHIVRSGSGEALWRDKLAGNPGDLLDII